MSNLSILDKNGTPYPITALNSYEAASSGRRMSSWGTDSSGPNSLLSAPLAVIRSRARTAVRNNPIASGAVDSFVSNLVGTDISPRWNIDDPALKEALQELWFDSQEELDANGVYDFYGLQEQVARSMIEGGEALARFRPRRPSGNLLVPLQIQLMEGDHLDSAYNGIAPNGNRIIQGIEWNRFNQRAAYWLYVEHPGEQYFNITYYVGQRVRVPADQMLHIYRPTRIGQIRGCSWLVTVLLKLKEMDEYQDAELVRKKTAALLAFFFKTPANTAYPPVGMPGAKDANNNQVVAVEPGTSVRLKPGEDIYVSEPADLGGAYKDFIRQNFLEAAKGIGITYEQLTGDLSGVNYSSIRAGLIEFRRLCEMLQERTLIHQFCRPVIRRWLDVAILSNAITIKNYYQNRRKYWRVKWRPDGWDYVDPVKDRLAEQMDVRNGFDSRDAVVARRGRDVEVVDSEIEKDNKRADEKGLIFDSDPRNTAKTGAIQSSETETLKEATN